jgi:hypothetical protein
MEEARLLVVPGRYVADIVASGRLHIAFLRSLHLDRMAPARIARASGPRMPHGRRFCRRPSCVC